MTDSTSDIYLVDGNITIFLGTHLETFKQDILYSSLLGNLISNSNSIASDAWLSSYTKFLGGICWTTKSNGKQIIKKQPTSLLKIANTKLSNSLSSQELSHLAECFASIKQLPKESEALQALLKRLQLDFPDNQNQNNQATNIICPLITIICANKIVISLHAAIDTLQPVSISILDEILPEKAIVNDIETSVWVSYLSEDNYASVRNKVIEKLGSKIKTNLFHLESPR